MSKRIVLALGAYMAVMSIALGAGRAPTSGPATAPANNVTIKRQLLSEHQTVAKLTGIAYQRCRGLTSRCPDNCGDSGDYATFQILAYVKYAKPGEYGDPKSTSYTFQVNDNRGAVKISKDYADKVRALKPGDHVLLNWNHDYVTREEDGTSASFPERPLSKVEPISKEDADKLVAAQAK